MFQAIQGYDNALKRLPEEVVAEKPRRSTIIMKSENDKHMKQIKEIKESSEEQRLEKRKSGKSESTTVMERHPSIGVGALVDAESFVLGQAVYLLYLFVLL